MLSSHWDNPYRVTKFASVPSILTECSRAIFSTADFLGLEAAMKLHHGQTTLSIKTSLASFHPEMALFRNLCVNLRDRLCDVPMYASAQSLDFLDLAEKGHF
jgi:hypothetical protein